MTNEKNSLSCQEICAIIKKCQSCGVTSFQMGELKLSFETSAKVIVDRPKPAPVSAGPAVELTPEIEEQIKEASELAMKEAELIQKEAEISIMHIENPEAWEESLANGTIDDMENQLGDEYAELERRRS